MVELLEQRAKLVDAVLRHRLRLDAGDATGCHLDPDWSSIARHGAYLPAFTLVVAWLSVRAFRTYQRSV